MEVKLELTIRNAPHYLSFSCLRESVRRLGPYVKPVFPKAFNYQTADDTQN